MRAAKCVLGFSLLLLLVAARPADDSSGINEEGFVQRWLVLAPIPFAANESGADALGKEQVKDEAKLKPKAGAKVKVGDKELVWKDHVCKEHLLDFNAILDAVTEASVAYAVTWVAAPDELQNGQMTTGSAGQATL